jgi:predicted enzyme related to lactoylglutathione lyase
MNNVMYFEIQVNEPESAIAFYETVFGWTFTRQPGIPIPYWRIETTGIHGGMMQRPAPAPPMGHGTNAYTCSMEVENFDATASNILSNGGIVALEKFAIPGVCWQGYFVDPQGNTFGIFQADPNAA